MDREDDSIALSAHCPHIVFSTETGNVSKLFAKPRMLLDGGWSYWAVGLSCYPFVLPDSNQKLDPRNSYATFIASRRHGQLLPSHDKGNVKQMSSARSIDLLW